MTGRSGWCPPDIPHAAAHRVCQMRQDEDDERTRLDPCSCTDHGGHVTRESERER